MATIQKFTRSKGIVYRVLIRKADTKPISKTFTRKKLAIQFAQSIDSNREFFEASKELGFNFVLVGNQVIHSRKIMDYSSPEKVLGLMGL